MTVTPSPYVPKAEVSLYALFNLLFSLVLASVLLGLAAHLVSKLIYLMILFPWVMGLGLGRAGAWMIRLYSIRSPALCLPAGWVGGLLTAVAMHYAGFVEL